MSKFRVCPDCGAHLDFGERCDCQRKKEGGRPAGTGTASFLENTISHAAGFVTEAAERGKRE